MAARHALGHGPQQGRRRIPTEHGHVCDVEVAVLMAVGIGEMRAGPFHGPERRVVVTADMPGHGHTVGHNAFAALEQFGAFRVGFTKARIFAVF